MKSILFTMIMVTIAINVQAEQLRVFSYSQPVAKSILEREVKASFTDQTYIQPSEFILPVAYQNFLYAIPEETFLAELSSLINDDDATRVNLLDEKSVILEGQVSYDADEARTQINDLLVGKKVRLQRLVTLENLSVIVFDIVDTDGSTIITMAFPYTFESGKWKICNDCSIDSSNPAYIFVNDNAYDFEGSEDIISKIKVFTPVPRY
ncbi:MAG TPA: hypothetical protein VI298_03290 [Geobacteraceae bacterium]